ncbi:MAG: heavy-metal-associated domain-containing protein [Planctomycetes bacterium]|nr:heavy-metal-associated domain-containing protein [Planctomycetota bacterium]
MKHIPLLLLLVAGFWLGRVALRAGKADYHPVLADVPHALRGDAPAGFRDLDIAIEGMCGPCCERTLYDKVLAVDGVECAAVSYDEEVVHVRYAADHDASALLAALTTDQHTPTLAGE